MCNSQDLLFQFVTIFMLSKLNDIIMTVVLGVCYFRQTKGVCHLLFQDRTGLLEHLHQCSVCDSRQ
jgi:hypothetical protein